MMAIDGDALKEEIDYYIREAGWGETRNEALRWCLEFIDNQPTIKPERKKGKWTDLNAPHPNYATCSECGFMEEFAYENNFCPMCGADMREDQTDDNRPS